ncbi:MAG: hypothetical protein AABX29_00490, partial [Nanoarchaeota archaeon]
HGTPDRFYLTSSTEDAYIYGNSSGPYGINGPYDDVSRCTNPICIEDDCACLDTYKFDVDARLFTGFSCMIGRINGIPSTLVYEDSPNKGDIKSSVLLSLLKSRVLNIVAATHVASSSLTPDKEIAEDVILKGQPVGIAIKNFKNKYLYNLWFADRDWPGSPRSDNFTLGWLKHNLKMWVLFGDPEMKISNLNIEPRNCLVKLDKKFDENGKITNINILINKKLSDFEAISQIQGSAVFSGSSCLIRISLGDREVKSLDLKYNGIKEEYSSILKDIIQFNGNELLFIVPSYIISENIAEFGIKVN